jgi:hypothetical protein
MYKTPRSYFPLFKAGMAQRFRVISSFSRRYPELSLILLLPIFGLSCFIFLLAGVTAPAFIFTLASILGGGYVLYSHAKYEEELDSRVERPRVDDVWRATINGVTVGTISDRELAILSKGVYFNYKLVLGQVFDVLSAGLKGALRGLYQLPLVWGWGLAILAIMEPSVFNVSELATPMLSSSVVILVIFSIILMLAFKFVMASPNLDKLLLSRFEDELRRRVRLLLYCAAEGELGLHLELRGRLPTENSKKVDPSY